MTVDPHFSMERKDASAEDPNWPNGLVPVKPGSHRVNHIKQQDERDPDFMRGSIRALVLVLGRLNLS